MFLLDGRQEILHFQLYSAKADAVRRKHDFLLDGATFALSNYDDAVAALAIADRYFPVLEKR